MESKNGWMRAFGRVGGMVGMEGNEWKSNVRKVLNMLRCGDVR